MDSFGYRTTRRPNVAPVKRPCPTSPTPTTPKHAKLTRPKEPPPLKKKPQRSLFRDVITCRTKTSTSTPPNLCHPLNFNDNEEPDTSKKSDEIITNTTTTTTTATTTKITTTTKVPAELAATTEIQAKLATTINVQEPETKITSGPLKGVSTSLLDLIRAKEAAAKETSPKEERIRVLLGIAPEIARIIPTVFTANKKEVMLYDKVIEKCYKGLKSNYTSETIIECLELMDKVVPEWVTTVTISRGKFMRINRDKYTSTQLREAIKKYPIKRPK